MIQCRVISLGSTVAIVFPSFDGDLAGRRGDAEHHRLRTLADQEPRISHWRAEYAKGLVLLREDHAFPGAEGVFEQALTNGLLAIASAERPGLISPTNALPAASRLAREMAGVPEVDQQNLVQAVSRTSAPRHGRGPGGVLTDDDVQLLDDLDTHPALVGAGSNELLDSHWAKAEIENHYEARRAVDYLALLDYEEVERRVEAAKDLLYLSPEDQLIVGDPQECPVCEHATMNREGGDDFGHGFTAGTCVVCSYRRSDAMAYSRGMDVELARQMEKDD